MRSPSVRRWSPKFDVACLAQKPAKLRALSRRNPGSESPWGRQEFPSISRDPLEDTAGPGHWVALDALAHAGDEILEPTTIHAGHTACQANMVRPWGGALATKFNNGSALTHSAVILVWTGLDNTGVGSFLQKPIHAAGFLWFLGGWDRRP